MDIDKFVITKVRNLKRIQRTVYSRSITNKQFAHYGAQDALYHTVCSMNRELYSLHSITINTHTSTIHDLLEPEEFQILVAAASFTQQHCLQLIRDSHK
jgi:hypothetical protein